VEWHIRVIEELESIGVELAEVRDADLEQALPLAVLDGALSARGAGGFDLQVAELEIRALRQRPWNDRVMLGLVIAGVGILIRSAGRLDDLDSVGDLAAEVVGHVLRHLDRNREQSGLVGRKDNGIMRASRRRSIGASETR
jgi:hypothetical protein